MTLALRMMGRFGNLMFQYAYGRALAEQTGKQLITPSWIGQQIFDLGYPEQGSEQGDDEVIGPGYYQHQGAIIYSKADAQRWFAFKPEIRSRLSHLSNSPLLAHRRIGDYSGAGYVVVSEKSYYRACTNFGLPKEQLEFVSEETPCPGFEGELSFLPDFFRMATCQTLLRGNSSFSWWAAMISDAKVFSPVITGLAGGREHDVEFVEGNSPRLADLEFVTDLHLP